MEKNKNAINVCDEWLKSIKMQIGPLAKNFDRWKYSLKHCRCPGIQVVYSDEILVDYDLERVMSSQNIYTHGLTLL